MAAVVVVTAFLAMILVPVQSASKEIQVSPRSSATADLSIPRAGWVTVHFDHVGGSAGMMAGSGMTYWMDGPSGMMFNHSMMRADDSYSFWTWGGTYRCGAGYAGLGPGMMDVWVNASWGML